MATTGGGFNYTVLVTDSLTGQPVPGVSIFVDDLYNAQTISGADGTAGIFVKSAKNAGSSDTIIKASRDGYSTFSVTKARDHISVGGIPEPIVLTPLNASKQVIFTVVNVARAPIAGARVFVGSAAAVTTGSDGKASFNLPYSDGIINVVADGYWPGSVNFSFSATSDPPDGIVLTPTTAISRILNFIVEPVTAEPGVTSAVTTAPTTGATINVTDKNGALLESGLIVDSNGRSVSRNAFVDGDYTIAIALVGRQPILNDLLVLPGQNDYTFNMGLVQDSGNPVTPMGSTAPSTDNTFLQSLTPAALAPIQDYEFISPNSEDGKYFTATQARIYIGNLFVDEVDAIQFAAQSNKIPIFGYASEFYDAMGKGKSLVQGQISLNFISEGYLFTILSEYQRVVLEKLSTARSVAGDQAKADQLKILLDQLDANGGRNRDAILFQINALQPTDPNTLTLMKKTLEGRQQLASSDRLTGKTYPNPVYQPVIFDIEFNMDGAGRTVTRRLEKCIITGNEQIYDQSGNVLKDTYSFIARRLR